MTARVAQGDLQAAASNLIMKGLVEQMNDFLCEMIGSGPVQTLTINSGSVTPPVRGAGFYAIETEGASPTDDLNLIATTNVNEGRILCITIFTASQVPTIKHGAGGTGRILLADGQDFVMTSTAWKLWVKLEGTSWVEFMRSYGSDFATQREFLRVPHVLGENTLDPYQRLRVDYASTSTITIAADSVILRDSSGRQKKFSSVSETFNVASTGAGGRVAAENSGNEKASDWYHLWLIGKDDGTIDAFGSLAAFPGGADIFALLPSGYTYAGYYSAAYNNASSNFDNFWQRGNEVTLTLTGVLNGGTATSRTSVSLASAVPDTAIGVRGMVSGVPASPGTQTSVSLYPDATADAGRQSYIWSSSGAVLNSGEFSLLLKTPASLGYAVGSGDSADIDVTRFWF